MDIATAPNERTTPDRGALARLFVEAFPTLDANYVYFFRDRDAGVRWTAAHPGTFLLPREAAFDIGRRVNAARYPETLRNQGRV